MNTNIIIIYSLVGTKFNTEAIYTKSLSCKHFIVAKLFLCYRLWQQWFLTDVLLSTCVYCMLWSSCQALNAQVNNFSRPLNHITSSIQHMKN